jgi:hypothetical protein
LFVLRVDKATICDLDTISKRKKTVSKEAACPVGCSGKTVC